MCGLATAHPKRSRQFRDFGLPRFARGERSLQQIRPPRRGQRLRLGLAPGGDLGVIAGEQNVRNRRGLRSRAAWYSADIRAGRSRNSLRCRIASLPITPGSRRTAASSSTSAASLAAGEHIIADRNLFEIARFDHPLVDAFETAADERRRRRRAASSRTRACVSGLPRGLMSKRGRAIVRRERGIEARGEHIGAHHHAGAAAGGRVVHAAMPAEAVGADIDASQGSRCRAPAHRRRAKARAGPETSRERA